MTSGGPESELLEALAGIDEDTLLAQWRACCVQDGVLRGGQLVDVCPRAASVLISVLSEPYGFEEEIGDLAEVAQEVLDHTGTGGLSTRQILALGEAIAVSIKLPAGPVRVEFDRRLRIALGRLVLYVNVAALQLADHLAHRDVLTGLRNRLAFNTETEKLAEKGLRFQIVFIDVDGLKQVNDGLGHDAGDHLLRRVGALLSESCAGGEYAYRFGGDEYAFVSTVRSASEVEGLMAQLSSEVTPFSWGVATFPDDGTSTLDVTEAADLRMYERKRQRKGAQASAPFPISVLLALWTRTFGRG